MNNQDYLDQIVAAAEAKSTNSGNKLISPLMWKIIIGGVALTIVVIIFGVILGNINGQAGELAKQLSVRLSNVSETISTYNPNVQSSTLRQHGTQVQSTINNTQTTLNSFLEQKYGYKKADEKSQMYKDEQAHIDEANQSLEHAKLNAYLDRIYVSELSHQVELIIALSGEIYQKTDNNELKNIMFTEMTSLANTLDSLEKDAANIK